MINELIGTVLQVLVFSLIPFIVYAIKKKTAKGFFEYVGLKQSTRKANLLAVVACLLFATPPLLLTFISDDFKEIMFDPSSVTGKYRQMEFGFEPLIILLAMAIFKTALAEEILFRGFVAKRLISLLGFVKGNLIQSFIFGIIHTAVFTLATNNLLFLITIFIIPAAGSYVSVYLNEKLARGSIIPGWISHALANILAYGLVGFVM